jgi:hypothetical protein
MRAIGLFILLLYRNRIVGRSKIRQSKAWELTPPRGWNVSERNRRSRVLQIAETMVARDGIEPPTPAFSGPRSTTELPGQLLYRACAGSAVHSSGRDAASPSALIPESERDLIGAKPRARQLRQYSIQKPLLQAGPAPTSAASPAGEQSHPQRENEPQAFPLESSFHPPHLPGRAGAETAFACCRPRLPAAA